MNKMKVLLVFVFVIPLLIVAKSTYAVYFAQDTVYIYEDGDRINDSNLIWVADYGYGDMCEDGVCIIGQQFIPATIYRLKTKDVTMFGDFKESGRSKQGVEYHEYLSSKSDYLMIFNPTPSSGGEGCGSPNCIGGRIGDNRTLRFDIKTGTIDYNFGNTNSTIWTRFISFIKNLFK